MAARIERVDPQRPEADILARAGEALRRGFLVVYPTETFYGLACDPRQAEAVERIFAAKGRPDRMALPLIAAERDAVQTCTRAVPEAAHRLMDAFWPGPLTIVLPASEDLPQLLLGGGRTVGVRVSSHPVASGLERASGGPIVATSANRSGGPPPSTAREAEEALGELVTLILDGGPAAGGSASTVVDLTVDPPRLIRSGAVPRAAIEAVLGRILD